MHPTPRQSPFVVTAIQELDSGVNAHTRWLGDVHKSLVCGTAPDANAVDVDSHRYCKFGQWLDSAESADWQRWSAELRSVEESHRTLHELAQRMLECRALGQAIPVDAYEAFVEHSLRFKLAVRALEFGLISDVCLIDHLTGVWNRSSMMQRLAEEYDRMLRTGQAGCLCMMDLDHFKAVNDRHGHLAGDAVLQAIARIANRRLRPYDSMFRYGGEEFLFCLPNTSPDMAVAAMERVRADIEASIIPVKDAGEVRVTASFGVAAMSATLSMQECVEEADRALFCAKAGGRNRVCRWDTAG
jgi:diguanylate cyclase (GGDEF)-like protein